MIRDLIFDLAKYPCLLSFAAPRPAESARIGARKAKEKEELRKEEVDLRQP